MHQRTFLKLAGIASVVAAGILLMDRAEAAPGSRLTVGPIRRVGVRGAKYFEPWIAASPCDASNLVIRDVRLSDGFVAIAVDQSNGPRKGRIYALTHNRSDDPPGLQLQTSQNAVDWTPPVSVPGLRGGPTPHAAIAVSPQGVLGLSWIQGNPGELVRPFDKAWTAREHDWTLYFIASTDGGTTFSAPAAVLPRPSSTDARFPNWPYRGDYISLAASADGAFHPLWIDTRDNKGEIQTATIEVQP